jgi:predicted nuclease of restriction endonuclease-like (RecB) superfamily
VTPKKQEGNDECVQQPPAQSDAVPADYAQFLEDLKSRVLAAQTKAAVAVNRELIEVYWLVGRDILERQKLHGWGAKVIDRLATDLRNAFPGMKGFSSRNLKYMRAFAEAYPDVSFVQQAAAQIPWFHHCTLLDKVKDPIERTWYVRQTSQQGWSRNVLTHQIDSGLFQRQGQALTNFDRALPAPQSDLARQLIKDPYVFDFLSLGPEAQERELEHGLIDHIRKFLLELGVGFAFVGSQYPLEVGGEDFYLDLLFYHLKLRCYVVIELKMGAFKPEYAGKMNFYLSAVDDLLRHPDDQLSIGLILCKERNKTIVEYALRDTQKPIGVSAYKMMNSLPHSLAGSLPAADLLAAELDSVPAKPDGNDVTIKSDGRPVDN